MKEDNALRALSELSETDIDIIRHREAHFSGSFSLMIEYYATEGRGRDPDFSISRLHELKMIEEKSGQNLASLTLADDQKEEIEKSRALYQRLKEIYSKGKKSRPEEILIADLILSEEEYPEKEIEKICLLGKRAIPFLIALMRNEELRNPLFPGFGKAPSLAIDCLREIKDESAIIALFEEIGHEEVVDEEGALLALREIGRPAELFLLKVLSSRPITSDNERAAVALIHFKDHQEVSKAAIDLLESQDFRNTIPLSCYLALIAEGTHDETLRERFRKMALEKGTPKVLQEDMLMVTRSWDKKKKAR
ncbi:hypothetical protein [Estrella lausannensis]|uniref:HEAT repeat domain-containing protein n=1 Tax=Estrella lausannensis TaxID=483423 RepID=A0A0H5DMN1_9BACT|nr:hypothetical protein [Estrella lausannensis]CRX37381.1 Conserved hypothetical protein [Estrella lausannensis]